MSVASGGYLPRWIIVIYYSFKIFSQFWLAKTQTSSLRSGTKAFTCGNNFGIDNVAESKFGTHKEFIILNILKCKHCVNKSRDLSRDHFAKNRKHEEPHKVPLLIILSDGCFAQFPVIILPPTSCMLAGVGLAVVDSDLHRGNETILNIATVC